MKIFSKHFFLLSAVFYAMLFPLLNISGGVLVILGLFIFFPFLPMAWIFGMAGVWLFGNDAYLVFSTFSIFFQVLICLEIFIIIFKKD